MVVELDGESDIKESSCPECGRPDLLVTTFVLRDGEPYGMAKTALRDHDGQEAWIDVALGDFDERRTSSHVSFGCRVGPIEGSSEPAASAVHAAQCYGDAWFWGHKLTRDEALAHPRIDEFWTVVDFLLVHEPSIQHHVYHLGLGGDDVRSRRRVTWWRRRRGGR